VSVNDVRKQIVANALSHLGKPYSMDPALRLGPVAFDCSGLAWHCYMSAGVSVDNNLMDWVAEPISRDALLPGDLVYIGFETRPMFKWPTGSHVGIYVGDGDVVHSTSKTGKVVRERIEARNWTWYGRVPAAHWPGGENT